MAYTTIDDPTAYFQTKTYTGNGSTQSITFDGTSDMQPNMNWTKVRSETGSHRLTDDIRGLNKPVFPNGTDAEGTEDNYTSFDSDGFSLKNASVNEDTRTYVAWCWKTGTAFSNDASSTGIGTIDSSGSSNQTAGFSIVSYTSNGSSSQSVAHNLGGVPEMIISKNRDSTSSAYNYWTVYHHSLATANDTKLKLNATEAASTTNEWGDTDPTSTVYSLHTSGDGTTNHSTDKMISYCFRGIKGYSKIGSYVGNGNNGDGPFIYTGFKPAFCLVKRITSGENWLILDNKRDTFNPQDSSIYPNLNNAEDADGADYFDFVSNGMKVKTNNGGTNTDDVIYIYMAFAESPLVTSTGVPTTAR